MKAYKNYAEKNLKFVRTEFESKSLDCVMNTVLTVIFCLIIVFLYRCQRR